MFFRNLRSKKLWVRDQPRSFNYCYGILPQGNVAFDPHGEFTGKNILYRAHSLEEAAVEFSKQTDEIQDILTGGRQIIGFTYLQATSALR